MLGQDQADQWGAPVGVLLAQGLGLQDECCRSMRADTWTVIGRRGCLAALVAGQAKQVINGSHWQMETLSQGLGGESALVAAEQRLTDR
jgi:hypothetical protein